MYLEFLTLFLAISPMVSASGCHDKINRFDGPLIRILGPRLEDAQGNVLPSPGEAFRFKSLNVDELRERLPSLRTRPTGPLSKDRRLIALAFDSVDPSRSGGLIVIEASRRPFGPVVSIHHLGISTAGGAERASELGTLMIAMALREAKDFLGDGHDHQGVTFQSQKNPVASELLRELGFVPVPGTHCEWVRSLTRDLHETARVARSLIPEAPARTVEESEPIKQSKTSAQNEPTARDRLVETMLREMMSSLMGDAPTKNNSEYITELLKDPAFWHTAKLMNLSQRELIASLKRIDPHLGAHEIVFRHSRFTMSGQLADQPLSHSLRLRAEDLRRLTKYHHRGDPKMALMNPMMKELYNSVSYLELHAIAIYVERMEDRPHPEILFKIPSLAEFNAIREGRFTAE